MFFFFFWALTPPVQSGAIFPQYSYHTLRCPLLVSLRAVGHEGYVPRPVSPVTRKRGVGTQYRCLAWRTRELSMLMLMSLLFTFACCLTTCTYVAARLPLGSSQSVSRSGRHNLHRRNMKLPHSTLSHPALFFFFFAVVDMCSGLCLVLCVISFAFAFVKRQARTRVWFYSAKSE